LLHFWTVENSGTLAGENSKTPRTFVAFVGFAAARPRRPHGRRRWAACHCPGSRALGARAGRWSSWGSSARCARACTTPARGPRPSCSRPRGAGAAGRELQARRRGVRGCDGCTAAHERACLRARAEQQFSAARYSTQALF
jgi:hypothetical protein